MLCPAGSGPARVPSRCGSGAARRPALPGSAASPCPGPALRARRRDLVGCRPAGPRRRRLSPRSARPGSAPRAEVLVDRGRARPMSGSIAGRVITRVTRWAASSSQLSVTRDRGSPTTRARASCYSASPDRRETAAARPPVAAPRRSASAAGRRPGARGGPPRRRASRLHHRQVPGRGWGVRRVESLEQGEPVRGPSPGRAPHAPLGAWAGGRARPGARTARTRPAGRSRVRGVRRDRRQVVERSARAARPPARADGDRAPQPARVCCPCAAGRAAEPGLGPGSASASCRAADAPPRPRRGGRGTRSMR